MEENSALFMLGWISGYVNSLQPLSDSEIENSSQFPRKGLAYAINKANAFKIKIDQELISACLDYVDGAFENVPESLALPNQERWLAGFYEGMRGTRNKLQLLRKAKGLTQRELAEKSGLALKRIQVYEIGYRDIRRTVYADLQSIAKALDCTVENIVTDLVEK